MRTTDKLILTFLLAFILGFYLRTKLSNAVNNYNTEEGDTFVTYNIDSSKSYITNPTIIKQGEIQYVNVPVIIDTTQIINDYFALHPFSREFRDSNVVVLIEDTISKNNFNKSSFTYRILKPQTIKKTVIKEMKSGVYFGVISEFNKSKTLTGLSPSLDIQTKKRMMYSVGYDVLGQELNLGVKYKIINK